MPPTIWHTLSGFATRDQALAAAATVAVLAVLALAGRGAHRALKGRRADDVLTFTAATLATTISLTSMWRFAGEVLHFTGPERALLFAIFEITVITCAVRARRNIQESASHTAGTEGAVIWILSLALGGFATQVATSSAEAAFRFALPPLATWLWERSLLPARREAKSVPWWQRAIEQARVRLGLADAPDATVSDRAATYRLMRLARASVRATRARNPLTRWWWTWRTRALLEIGWVRPKGRRRTPGGRLRWRGLRRDPWLRVDVAAPGAQQCLVLG